MHLDTLGFYSLSRTYGGPQGHALCFPASARETFRTRPGCRRQPIEGKEDAPDAPRRLSSAACFVNLARRSGLRARSDMSWWLAPVPSQRNSVNPVRPGREQPKRLKRVPGCGWRRPPPRSRRGPLGDQHAGGEARARSVGRTPARPAARSPAEGPGAPVHLRKRPPSLGIRPTRTAHVLPGARPQMAPQDLR
jgi:hypothetical protein